MSVDPFTFEIVRHKFMRVVDEAVSTLKHISGSSTTTEGHDLLVGLYRADGSLLMAVVGYLHALPGAGEACRHILREYLENPGIFDGDVFLLNDPYIAALHSSDAYVVSPIFYREKLVAWSANFVHLRDIGAINPGGFAPQSREIYHEGIMCPGLKIVERGVLRKDVWKTVLNMVRIPEIVALDLHSQISANITVKERLRDLFDKYGPETVDEVAQGIIDESETLLRRRLRELPDGTWRTRQYLEALGKIYTVNLAMTKQGDSLHYDFTGTSGQAPVGFNVAYWGAFGAILAPLFPMLGYDMMWNDGMLKPITMHAPQGTLVNCTRPAPNCLATITGIGVVNNVSQEAISKMLVASDEYRKEATCVWQGAHCPTTVAGHKGSRYVVGMLTQDFGGCGGARTFKDGVDFAGTIPNPINRTPNIEGEELQLPVLYLFHRLLKDSSGPGRFRGGLTTEFAVTAHGAANDQVNLVLYGTGTEYTQCQGFFGGYPGSNTGFVLYRGKDVYELVRGEGFPEEVEEIGGSREPAVWGIYPLKKGEMLHGWFMGGGGYGDPVERDPERVRNDVVQGTISRECAREIYRVALNDDLEVDPEETSRLKRETRERRLKARTGVSSRDGGADPRMSAAANPAGGASYNLSDDLRAVKASGGVRVQCRGCDHVLSGIGEHWKDRCRVLRSPLTESGPRRSANGIFEMRQYACPSCGRLLDVEVALPEDPPLHDEVRVPL
ncbi:MAG: hydantoinase B/oxoprolinase family protein [Candidatus Tectomicrobia bacterium]|nr:hydantoinase B/oxoprolinase family protein [Candidatus Tectomicrobia bacterium]